MAAKTFWSSLLCFALPPQYLTFNKPHKTHTIFLLLKPYLLVCIILCSFRLSAQQYDAQWALSFNESVLDFRTPDSVKIYSLPLVQYSLTTALIYDLGEEGKKEVTEFHNYINETALHLEQKYNIVIAIQYRKDLKKYDVGYMRGENQSIPSQTG